MRNFILYSSEDCCLCDQAMVVLAECKQDLYFDVKKVDIYRDKSLLVKYKFSIPVVKDASSSSELAWPFTAIKFKQWLAELESVNGP